MICLGYFVNACSVLADAGFSQNTGRRCWVDDTQFLSADGWTSWSAIRLGSQPPRIKLIQQTSQSPVLATVEQAVTTTPMIYNLQVTPCVSLELHNFLA